MMMTTYLVATVTRYVLVDAADEAGAREQGRKALHDLYADVRAHLGRDVPIAIHTVRPATPGEIEQMQWHNAMTARETAWQAGRDAV